MPTKRTRIGRHRTQKTVDSLGISEMIYFIGGWTPLSERDVPWRDNPEAQAREHWQTWQEYIGEWAAVRDDWKAQDPPPGNTPAEDCFAERLYQRYGPSGPSILDRNDIDDRMRG